MQSIALRALQFASSFEAEVFVHLLLRNWNHPLAEDEEFRNELLEDATHALQLAVEGEIFIESVKAEDFNFIASVWYIEWTALQSGNDEVSIREGRGKWVLSVKHSLPSCFCDTDDLLP